MPNATLTPQELEKIATRILSDQQVLEQLTPELLDPIEEQKMYEQSQQTTVAGTALYKNEIKFFTPHEVGGVIYRYTQHFFFIYSISQITHDLNLLDQLNNILRITQTRTFSPTTKTLPNTTLTRRDLDKIAEEIFNDQTVLEQLVPEILPSIVKNQEQEMYEESKKTTNTNDQKIMELMQQVATPPFAILNNNLIFFTSDEIKNAIYRYKKNVTKINDLKRITGDPNFLKYLTNILDFFALAGLRTPFD